MTVRVDFGSLDLFGFSLETSLLLLTDGLLGTLR